LYRQLRKQIVDGDIPAGERIPTRRALQQQYDAAPQTVDRAVQRLIEGGFCEARGRRGTFVVDHPPHLCRYGLLFPTNAPGETHSTFYAGLEAIAEQISDRRQEFQVVSYHGIHVHARSEDYARLLADLRHRRLAGIITAVPPHVRPADELLQEPAIPQVGIQPSTGNPKTPAVAPDVGAFREMALDHLRALGCRRIGFVQLNADVNHDFDAVARLCAERELITQPAWYQAASVTTPGHAIQLAQLMVFSRQPAPPDGIIIADDHLVPTFTEGLRRAGAGSQLPMQVVAHCNEPYRPEAHVPVHWLGFDLEEIMELCFDTIARQRRGEPVKPMTWVRPHLEALDGA
jgi:DNA-binding LacI/PurR family transcriptional regulator